eukprot:jgi/Tetstr1/431234/TSEL_002053.t1
MVLRGAKRWRAALGSLQASGAYSQPASIPRILWFDATRTLNGKEVTFSEAQMLKVFDKWRDEGAACDWEADRSVCTVCLTTKYTLTEPSRQVTAVDAAWGLVAGSLQDMAVFGELYGSAFGGVGAHELWDGDVEYLHKPNSVAQDSERE